MKSRYASSAAGRCCSDRREPAREREAIQDVARNLSLWVDAIVARVFVIEFGGPGVVRLYTGDQCALSDREHPCQTIADLLTLPEAWSTFSGKELVYIGDWNNVSRSLWQACSLAGLRFRAICPEAYGPSSEEKVDWSARPKDVKGADAIYTDVWASMGQEARTEAERLEVFRPYQVNEELTGEDRQADTYSCIAFPRIAVRKSPIR